MLKNFMQWLLSRQNLNTMPKENDDNTRLPKSKIVSCILLIILSAMSMGDLDCSFDDDDDDDDDIYVTRPNRPSGPDDADVGDKVTFTTGGSYSNESGDIEYRIDFGDSTISDWDNSYSSSHTYDKQGTYKVSAQARRGTVTSAWSYYSTIDIDDRGISYVWQDLESLYAIAVGADGQIQESDGHDWQTVLSPTQKHLSTIYALSPYQIWIAGHDGILLYYNRQTIQVLPTPIAEKIISLCTLPNKNLVVLTNAGDVWCMRENDVWQKITTATMPCPKHIFYNNATQKLVLYYLREKEEVTP